MTKLKFYTDLIEGFAYLCQISAMSPAFVSIANLGMVLISQDSMPLIEIMSYMTTQNSDG